MNCKPGDLAICIREGQYKGHLFEVLYLAPATSFTLPDGTPHHPAKGHPSWVIKSLAGGALAPFDNGAWKIAKYGVGADSALRPLRGIPDDEFVESEAHA